MTKTQRQIVNRIKRMYEEHDLSEKLIVYAIKRLGNPLSAKKHHDMLEWQIMKAESKLPPDMVEKLKKGEL